MTLENRRNNKTARFLTTMLMSLSLALLVDAGVYAQGYRLGDIPLDAETYQKHVRLRPLEMVEALPSAYDARDDGIITSPKDQGSCGSCWAFASVGAMESHLLKAYGVGPEDLSEQQQVSCNTSMSGCSGGNSSAIRYWETKGSLDESCFPYTANDTTPCGEAGCDQLGYRVVNWHTVAENEFKASLYNDGPSYWRYTVYSDFFTFWNFGSPGEVYINSSNSYEGGHAVLLIGWDDSKGAYLCKNSWGDNGGPNNDGTFWIAYSGHAQDLNFQMSNFDLTITGCSSDADCDDGLYCNGSETCVDTICQAGTAVDCPDDGLFCNGNEVCDEVNDECTHSGDPCTSPLMCYEVDDICVECFGDEDCIDGEPCTDDFCDTGTGQCSNTWPSCGPEDGCCAPGCSGLDDPDCSCGNGVCEGGEDCDTCPLDCISGQGGTCAACFKGVCNGDCHPRKEGPDCADCAPGYCCGDGFCEGDEDGYNCEVDCGPPPFCGDENCDPSEDPCGCPADCGEPPSSEVDCGNGMDDDCDSYTDCEDLPECAGDPVCTCLPIGTPCTSNGECCSNKCRGKKCR
jgi:hypothetical protein